MNVEVYGPLQTVRQFEQNFIHIYLEQNIDRNVKFGHLYVSESPFGVVAKVLA